MGVWRNWYTRTTQNRVPQGLRVRLPPRPPNILKTKLLTQNRMAQALRVQVPPPAPLGNSSAFCWRFFCAKQKARSYLQNINAPINSLAGSSYCRHCQCSSGTSIDIFLNSGIFTKIVSVPSSLRTACSSGIVPAYPLA